MAQAETLFSPGTFVVPARNPTPAKPTAAEIAELENANWNSIAKMRAALTAVDATYYSAARLDTMTKNDLVYAVRLVGGGVVAPLGLRVTFPPPPAPAPPPAPKSS